MDTAKPWKTSVKIVSALGREGTVQIPESNPPLEEDANPRTIRNHYLPEYRTDKENWKREKVNGYWGIKEINYEKERTPSV